MVAALHPGLFHVSSGPQDGPSAGGGLGVHLLGLCFQHFYVLVYFFVFYFLNKHFKTANNCFGSLFFTILL